MGLHNADRKTLLRPFRHQLAAVGPTATYDWLVAILRRQPTRLRTDNVIYVALTGDPRGLDWIVTHASAPPAPSVGMAAAMLHPRWERVHGWLRTNTSLQVLGLETLWACRPPVATMDRYHERCAPTLQDPPSSRALRQVLAEVLAERFNAHTRGLVANIDRELDGIVRAEQPAVSPERLPSLVAG